MASDTPGPTVWPALRYDNAKAAIAFLVDAFGFEATLVVPAEGDRDVPHAELRWPLGGGVMLGSRSFTEDGHDAFETGITSIYVVTDEPDALFARATGAGAELVRGLADEDYGSRGFTVKDPEGNLWSFGTYRGTL
ncbi:MAG TPA: VOC family protein [Acidimicrobiales bacterium]|nr:VOC family protein [Acidimicrobiales bacterium]